MLVHFFTNNNDSGSCFILPNVPAAWIYAHSRHSVVYFKTGGMYITIARRLPEPNIFPDCVKILITFHANTYVTIQTDD
jgi:hypothetical protein